MVVADPSMAARVVPVVAYLDPGTGSLVMQVVVAGVLGWLATMRRTRDRLRGLLRRRPRDD